MLNKPRGAVTTASDEKGRQTVYEFLHAALPWVAPVGRLDQASEGLLLLTNDSEWAARVMSPASHLDKTYHVQIDRVADAGLLESIGKGVRTEDGDLLRFASVTHSARRQAKYLARNCFRRRPATVTSGGCWLRSALPVLRLIRVAIGPLPLGQLPKGKCSTAYLRRETGARSGSADRRQPGLDHSVAISSQ